MRIITLNVNGVRSAAKKGLYPWLAAQKADVVCLQEVKAHEADLDAAIVDSWRCHEAAEPDISTERLMEMVRGDIGADVDRQMKHWG